MPEQGLKHPYSRPPILEAVIALHFAPEIGDKAIERFVKKRQTDFPDVQQIVDVEMAINMANPRQSARIQTKGKQLRTTDGSSQIICRHEQMAYAKLAPYISWESLFSDAQENWEIFKQSSGSHSISKVSCRYINRIDIPINPADPKIELTNYFSAGISLPPLLEPLLLQDFNVSLNLVDPAATVIHMVRFLGNAPAIIDHASFTLDIDVVTMRELPTENNAIWEVISDLRRRKNDLFEAFITDATRRLFS